MTYRRIRVYNAHTGPFIKYLLTYLGPPPASQIDFRFTLAIEYLNPVTFVNYFLFFEYYNVLSTTQRKKAK